MHVLTHRYPQESCNKQSLIIIIHQSSNRFNRLINFPQLGYIYQSNMNMYNFWNPLLFFGYNSSSIGNSIISPLWFNTQVQNQSVHQPIQLKNQFIPQDSLIKIQLSQQEQPKEPLYQKQVKIKQVDVERHGSNSEDQQNHLSKIDLIKLKGSYKKLKWSQQDDQMLIDLYDNKGMRMHEVSQKFNNGACEKMCMTRYKRLKKTELKYWTREEDKIVKNTVAQIGEKWKEISKFLPNRNAKQIREHYINALRPQIKKTPWTPQQDMLVNKLVKQKGKQWRLFESFLVGRTENHIKNRYYGRIKKIVQIKNKIKQIQTKLQI